MNELETYPSNSDNLYDVEGNDLALLLKTLMFHYKKMAAFLHIFYVCRSSKYLLCPLALYYVQPT
jgi:hypothetical protein